MLTAGDSSSLTPLAPASCSCPATHPCRTAAGPAGQPVRHCDSSATLCASTGPWGFFATGQAAGKELEAGRTGAGSFGQPDELSQIAVCAILQATTLCLGSRRDHHSHENAEGHHQRQTLTVTVTDNLSPMLERYSTLGISTGAIVGCVQY